MGEALFSFPSQLAGDPSRRNWFRELLDDPGCNGDALRVQEAYISHRQGYSQKQHDVFAASAIGATTEPPVQADEALIAHLGRKAATPGPAADDAVRDMDLNCMVFWCRPSDGVLDVIAVLQSKLWTLLGTDLHLIPSGDMHLSVLEVSHCHNMTHLESVKAEVTPLRLQRMLSYAASWAPGPALVYPELGFDRLGVAINFVPAATAHECRPTTTTITTVEVEERQKNKMHAPSSPSPPPPPPPISAPKTIPGGNAAIATTYHHLRSELQEQLLESGISVDTCYTAATAHVAIGRFIGYDHFVREPAGIGTRRFLDAVEGLNVWLRNTYWGVDGGELLRWKLGEKPWELQAGYLKFGRETERADLVSHTEKCLDMDMS